MGGSLQEQQDTLALVALVAAVVGQATLGTVQLLPVRAAAVAVQEEGFLLAMLDFPDMRRAVPAEPGFMDRVVTVQQG